MNFFFSFAHPILVVVNHFTHHEKTCNFFFRDWEKKENNSVLKDSLFLSLNIPFIGRD